MWLINSRTYALEEFIPPVTIPYAILSHTWGLGEVTFQDMSDLVKAADMPGFAKIQLTCKQAVRDRLEYAWVDTCCIDKSSSAELSEAINSMFNWYKAATVCYAYISDISDVDNGTKAAMRTFATCRWFSRGWTLQELVAPRHVYFYNREWTYIGSRDNDLRTEISRITNIGEAVLTGKQSLSSTIIANRMSWASNRSTTRIEDMAYCLLGIFDINMPILYGEGPKAFMRLQEEILKNSYDLSLLAWLSPPGTPANKPRGLLARSPAEFRHGGDLKPARHQEYFSGHLSVTSRGLHATQLTIHQVCERGYLPLRCTHKYRNDAPESNPESWKIPGEASILLKKTMQGYVRQDTSVNYFHEASGGNIFTTLGQDFYAFRDLSTTAYSVIQQEDTSYINFRHFSPNESVMFRIARVCPSALWDSLRSRFFTYGLAKFTGFVIVNCYGNMSGGGIQPITLMVWCGLRHENGVDKPWVSFKNAGGETNDEVIAFLRDRLEDSGEQSVLESYRPNPSAQTDSAHCSSSPSASYFSITANAKIFNADPAKPRVFTASVHIEKG